MGIGWVELSGEEKDALVAEMQARQKEMSLRRRSKMWSLAQRGLRRSGASSSTSLPGRLERPTASPTAVYVQELGAWQLRLLV